MTRPQAPNNMMPAAVSPAATQQASPKSQGPPENNLPKIANYLADYSGCGFWRMLWPQQILNAHSKAVVMNFSIMVYQPDFYKHLDAVRIQRQATPYQLKFVEFLKQIQGECGFRLIYEIDDIIFREDIPDYNKFKPAFEPDEIRESSLRIMQLCDEITVTNPFMRDYYREKTGKSEVTVIPNFVPKFWMGNYYDPNRVEDLYKKNRRRPRVLYAGSGAHFDVENRTKQRDDFEHVLQAVIQSRYKYQWVFIGAFPMQLAQYVQSGEIEFHPWSRMFEYPDLIHQLGVQAMVAPLQDNNFNRAKSDLKNIEAAAYGLPCICQDMGTYKDAEVKFKTGSDMIRKLDEALSQPGQYSNNIPKRRALAEARFLEKDENIDCYLEVHKTPYGSPERKMLSKWNDDV